MGTVGALSEAFLIGYYTFGLVLLPTGMGIFEVYEAAKHNDGLALAVGIVMLLLTVAPFGGIGDVRTATAAEKITPKKHAAGERGGVERQARRRHGAGVYKGKGEGARGVGDEGEGSAGDVREEVGFDKSNFDNLRILDMSLILEL
jgi:hypothetical protein